MRLVRRNAVLIGAVLLVVAVFGGLKYTDTSDRERIDEVATETHAALCAFKQDLERRAESTQQFIDEIEGGERPPITGITVTDLERSVANQRATLRSLQNLECKEHA